MAWSRSRLTRLRAFLTVVSGPPQSFHGDGLRCPLEAPLDARSWTQVAFALAGSLIAARANAQVSDVQIRDGDVYVQLSAGPAQRLTRDGQSTEAARSRDGKLIAYVHRDGATSDGSMNSVSMCVVAARRCDVIVAPRAADKPEDNLTDIGSVQFSYQAGVDTSGQVIGSIFFLANAWAASGAIHRVTLGPNPKVTFVTDSNSLTVVAGGRFAGALEISQHRYGKQGAGSCGLNSIMDPNTGKRLERLPSPDCDGLGLP